MSHQTQPITQPHIKPFYEVIGTALRARGSVVGDFAKDPKYNECCYVVKMCQRLVELIARPDVGLEEVMRVERSASGHSDYQRKFAFYCYELQIGKSPIQAAVRSRNTP